MILYYVDNQKSGKVIFFIHGTGSTHEVWEKQYKLLNKTNYRIISIDLRGHGKSLNSNSECSIDDHINDIKETVEHIGIKEPMTLVGHSFGAVLAVKFAERFPEYTEKLLLVSLPAKLPNILIKYYKWFLGKPIEYIKKKLNIVLKLPLKKKYKLAISADLNVIRNIFHDSLKWDFLSSGPKINCPVYFSVGRFDYIALKSHVKKIHKSLPNSSYKEFNWASHTCMEDVPKEFNKWILSVLALTALPHY